MGITLSLLQELKSRQVLTRPGLRVLDVGNSNLYQADVAGIKNLVRAFRDADVGSDLDAFAERLHKGSAYDEVKGGINDAFAGELLERCGMDYVSIDIAKGYHTEVFDLNHDNLPRRYRKAFDVVLNVGTTEHVLNQYNSFKVVHDATKVGGLMVHQLPVSGFTDHGYFVYTGRMFLDLAHFNRYELVSIWHGAGGKDDVFRWQQSYGRMIEPLGALGLPAAMMVPNVSLTVVCRKTWDRHFIAALDTSTSVGEVPELVHAAYARSAFEKLKRYVRATGVLERFPALKARLRKFMGPVT